MKHYYRVMAGRGSAFAEMCFSGGFIGTDFGIAQDLSGKFPHAWRDFNREFIPIYLKNNPAKSRIAAGLACGSLWTVSKGIAQGDYVLCPDGTGRYRVGDVRADYFYKAGEPLPHRRPVRWLEQSIDRVDMSEGLRNSAGSIGTVSDISGYGLEIEKLMGPCNVSTLAEGGETIEDASAFALEKHLEDFLVENWAQSELGKDYDIYEEDGERVGQQYRTDTGPIDILAISKDKKQLLVVELKKGRASDAVVGQVLRYMGYVKEELAETGQSVQGVIVAQENDQKIRRALAAVTGVGFYSYEVRFKMTKVH